VELRSRSSASLGHSSHTAQAVRDSRRSSCFPAADAVVAGRAIHISPELLAGVQVQRFLGADAATSRHGAAQGAAFRCGDVRLLLADQIVRDNRGSFRAHAMRLSNLFVSRCHNRCDVRIQRGDEAALLVVWPVLEGLTDYAYHAEHDFVRAKGQALGIPVLDLYPAFAGGDPKDLCVSDRNPHPNPFAHQRAAQAIVDFLLSPTGQPLLRSADSLAG